MNKKISYLFLLAFFFSYGFLGSYKRCNAQITRVYLPNYTEPLEKRAELDFLRFFQTAGTGKMSSRSFDDNFFRVVGGESQRFFLNKSNRDVSYFDISNGAAHAMNIQKDAPFGLFIGQSLSKIYYYHGSDRGKVFYSFKLDDNSTKKHSIENFTVIRVVGIDNQPDIVLTCGVYTETEPRLGFYLVDLNTSKVTKTLHQFDLNRLPDGDPGIYAGDFYKFADQIFFRFSKRTGIFRFDRHANFVGELTTPDLFDFPKEQSEACYEEHENLYRELFVHAEKLYVRTNYINTPNRLIIFDIYDLKENQYINSLAVKLDPGGEYLFGQLWVFQHADQLNFLHKRKDNPSKYVHHVLDLNHLGR